MKKVALTANSNALKQNYRERFHRLVQLLGSFGIDAVCSDLIFFDSIDLNALANQKSRELCDYFTRSDVDAIFDISGGDAANLLLPRIDWEILKQYPKPFFGISDNSVLLNAIYVKTSRPTYHFRLSSLTEVENSKRFIASLKSLSTLQISPPLTFLQGEAFEGTVVGGNLRCFLKLAGTEFMPSLSGKILFIESLGGNRQQVASYFAQHTMLGEFKSLRGILFGTFTKLQSELSPTEFQRFLKSLVADLDLPVAYTGAIGHGSESEILPIGAQISIRE